ncbi:MAG: Sir2 family NAD-dependent protein deacetylase [Desulfobacterales bacterium]
MVTERDGSISNKTVERLAVAIMKARHLVGFTGAGISTESGLADFRGPDGVWTRQDKGLPPPRSRRIEDVRPNRAHKIVADLIDQGFMKFLISQNVDGLHIMSGVPLEKIAELHGNHHLMVCDHCDKKMVYQEAGWDRRLFGPGYRKYEAVSGQPGCPNCGARLYSSIVNFGDSLPEWDLKVSMEHAEKADLMLIIGSSLTVTPAAELPLITKRSGGKLVIINKGETALDNIADIRIWAGAGDTLEEVMKKIKVKLF